MTLANTLTSGLQLFASVTFSPEHRSPVAVGSAFRGHTSGHPTTIEQVLTGRGGSGLAMRWSADDASLRATWADPTQTS